MSESKWTLGPWFVSGVRFKMNGGEWLSVNRYDEKAKKDENIALAGYDPRNGAGTADARLIAASPDLAEALEKLLRLGIAAGAEKIVAGWTGPPEQPYTRHPDDLGATLPTTCGDVYALVEAISIARAALSRAKGEIR